jgi:hypothetical protein
MKKTFGAVAALALSAGLTWAAVRSQEPQMPKPQKEHEFLQHFVGTWEGASKFRMAADQPWMESKGIETNTMLGGFWLVSEMKSEMFGQPWRGLGTTGYDPYKKKYVSTWVDSMMPCLSVGEGTVDAAGKVMSVTISSTDCESGKPCTMRMTQEIKDKDTTTWSMFMTGKDGKEFECMKGESKRRK